VKPTGATTPTFSANNTNAAKNTTITFSKAGTYTIKLTSTTGTTVKTATTTIAVNQTLTSVAISPTTATVRWGQTQQFSGTPKDQFGAAMTVAQTWTIDAGGAGGTVSTAGLYTAPKSGGGTAKVRVTAGSFSAVSTVTIPSFTASKVNFQPASATTVSGYIVDGGATYAVRNSQQYGWSVSETDAAVDRAKNTNQLLDTNIGIKSGAKWEMAVPNGTYSVKVSVGDGLSATTNTIRLEGTSVFSAVKLNANVYSNKTVT
jgi:fibronectin type 3 domain-containing protein